MKMTYDTYAECPRCGEEEGIRVSGWWSSASATGGLDGMGGPSDGEALTTDCAACGYTLTTAEHDKAHERASGAAHD